jgi:hypothetical protein
VSQRRRAVEADRLSAARHDREGEERAEHHGRATGSRAPPTTGRHRGFTPTAP